MASKHRDRAYPAGPSPNKVKNLKFFRKPVRSRYIRREPLCREWRTLAPLAVAMSRRVMPATIIRPIATLPCSSLRNLVAETCTDDIL